MCSILLVPAPSFCPLSLPQIQSERTETRIYIYSKKKQKKLIERMMDCAHFWIIMGMDYADNFLNTRYRILFPCPFLYIANNSPIYFSFFASVFPYFSLSADDFGALLWLLSSVSRALTLSALLCFAAVSRLFLPCFGHGAGFVLSVAVLFRPFPSFAFLPFCPLSPL
jgi:hypothetical protein